MSSQENFQKVTNCVIEPMKRHWGVDFDADTISDFVDDLARFSKQSLEEAMGKLRRSQKRKPSLAAIIEACGYSPALHSGKESEYMKKRREWEEYVYVEAHKAIRPFLDGSDGLKAIEGMYYTELLRYLYETAESQLRQKKSIFLQIPDPLPQDWLIMGRQRKRSKNNEVASIAKPIKSFLGKDFDKYIENKNEADVGHFLADDSP